MITPPIEASPKSPQASDANDVWTYERRLAMYILGVMAVELPGLRDDLMDDSNMLTHLIEHVGDALIEGIHTLGCPHDLTLSQILDIASTYDIEYRKLGGAE